MRKDGAFLLNIFSKRLSKQLLHLLHKLKPYMAVGTSLPPHPVIQDKNKKLLARCQKETLHCLDALKRSNVEGSSITAWSSLRHTGLLSGEIPSGKSETRSPSQSIVFCDPHTLGRNAQDFVETRSVLSIV